MMEIQKWPKVVENVDTTKMIKRFQNVNKIVFCNMGCQAELN